MSLQRVGSLKSKPLPIWTGVPIPALLKPVYAEDFSRLNRGPRRIRLVRGKIRVLS